MASFAWGLAPSSARPQPSKIVGCTVPDQLWQNNLYLMMADTTIDADLCDTPTAVSLVPRLLLRELVLSVARRLLPHNEATLAVPRVSVDSARSSRERPPRVWRVSMTVCFPCDGAPVTRCVRMTAVLDAEHAERSHVVSITDAGVVPAEEATAGGPLPFNARSGELSV